MDKTIAVSSNRPDQPIADSRRDRPDRRKSMSVINLRHMGLNGRRQSFRREGDAVGHYVDWYSPRLALLGMMIVLCSCMDAFFTLNLLQMGAVELNLVMARLIETDIQTFVNAKIALTSLCVTLLLIHKNFRVVRAITVEHLLMLILGGYLMLLGYEVMLLTSPPY